jgi:glycine/serine hydroxymethyltransferase
MTEVLVLVLSVAFLAAMIVAVPILVRRYAHGAPLAALFAPKAVQRIDIVEQVAIDAKRKLVLVRHDDVEHLVMTGGPADIVIESGIGAPANSGEGRAPSTPPLRAPRLLGQVAGER